MRLSTHTWESGNKTILHGGGKEHGLSTHTQKPGNKTVLLIVTVLQLYSFNYTIQFEHMTDEHI